MSGVDNFTQAECGARVRSEYWRGWFPLSPTRMLLMDHRHSEPDGAFYPLRHDPAADNGLTWRNAIDHMFSPRHPHQVCAECSLTPRGGGLLSRVFRRCGVRS